MVNSSQIASALIDTGFWGSERWDKVMEAWLDSSENSFFPRVISMAHRSGASGAHLSHFKENALSQHPYFESLRRSI